jgi:hypothetical protein
MELLTQHALKHLGYFVLRYEITEIKNCDMKIWKLINDKNNTYQVQALASRTDLLYPQRRLCSEKLIRLLGLLLHVWYYTKYVTYSLMVTLSNKNPSAWNFLSPEL